MFIADPKKLCVYVCVFVCVGVYAFMCTHTLTLPLLLNPRYFD